MSSTFIPVDCGNKDDPNWIPSPECIHPDSINVPSAGDELNLDGDKNEKKGISQPTVPENEKDEDGSKIALWNKALKDLALTKSDMEFIIGFMWTQIVLSLIPIVGPCVNTALLIVQIIYVSDFEID